MALFQIALLTECNPKYQFLTKIVSSNPHKNLQYGGGGTLRWLKKPSMESMSHFGICIGSWDGSKFEQFSFSLISARNTDHVSKPRVGSLLRSKILRWLKIRRESEFEAKMIRILSNLKIFELKKVSQFGENARDQYLEPKLRRNLTIRILSHIKIPCIFRHVTLPPSMAFWTISGSLPPYSCFQSKKHEFWLLSSICKKSKFDFEPEFMVFWKTGMFRIKMRFGLTKMAPLI